MRGDDGVFEFFVCGYEFVEEPEELVNLLPRKVSVVTRILDFEGVHVVASSCHYVWQRVEAGVAYGNADSLATISLQELDEYVLAVESSFSPSSKLYLVYFSNHVFLNCRLLLRGQG